MTLTVARSEFILGGQKSGKSRRAELLARDWLNASPAHRAVLIATAQPWDEEMRERIARHQKDRAARVPGMATLEEPLDLAGALRQHSTAQTLIVVDCLTLWLTNWAMPANEAPSPLGGGQGWGPAAPDLEAGIVPAPPAPIPAFPQGGKEQKPLSASPGVVTKLAHAHIPGHAWGGVTPSPSGGGQGWGPAVPDLEAGLVPAPPAPLPAFPQGGKEQKPLSASPRVVTKLAHAHIPGHAWGGVTPSPSGGGQGWGPAAPELEAGLAPAPPAPIPAFPQGGKEQSHGWQAQCALFLEAIEAAPGPVVLVGNEIGLGVIPLGREVRAFVDALGLLNQQVAQTCQRVTLMAAGLPLTLKDADL